MTWHLPVEVSVGKELPVSYREVVEGASPNPRCSTDVHGCGLLYCRAEMDGGCPVCVGHVPTKFKSLGAAFCLHLSFSGVKL